MEKSGLIFTELHVRRMYGEAYDGLHARDLCGGLNIIYGPNAAGKTTLGRALQCVLWPDSGDRKSIIEALFTLDGHVWRIDLDAGNVRFQRSGLSADRPTLPLSEDCGRYHLYLHELLQVSEETSKPFARAILQEASGGIDIGEAQTSLDFKNVRPSSNNTLTKAADSEWKKVREAKATENALRDEQRRLTNLESELVEARAERARVDLLDRVIAFLKARDAATEKENLLRGFPEILDDMTGEEPERLKALRDAHSAAASEAADARAQIADAEAKIDSSIIQEPGLVDGFASGLQTRVHRLETLEQESDRLKKELSSLRTEQAECWRRIQGAVDEERARGLNVAEIGNLSDFVKEAEKVGAEDKVLGEQLDHYSVDAEEPAADLEQCRHAARILARWIEVGTSPSTSKSVRWILAATGMLILLSAVLIGSFWNPFGFGVALLAVLVFWTLWQLPHSNSHIDERRHLRREFERIGIAGPSEWESDAVGELLEGLFDKVARHRDREFRVEKISEVSRALERLQQRKETLQERRNSIIARLGLNAEVEQESLYYLVEALRKWQDLDGAVRGRGTELSEQGNQSVDLLEKINSDLRPYGFKNAADAAEAQQHLTALSEAAAAFEADSQVLSQGRKDLRRAERIIADTNGEIVRLFEKLNLEPDADATLHQLAGRLKEYRRLQEEKIEAGGRVNGARERLEEHPLYDPELLEASEESLQSTREDAAATASRIDHLTDAIKGIEARVRIAEREKTLEEIRARHEDALEKLRRKREEDYRAVVGWHLAEYVRRRTRDEQLPNVFHRARDIFGGITRHRYRLDFDDRTEQFTAYDNLLQRGRTLDQLSSGTRVQLLLAVRLAFLEQQENGVMVPLVLDETLANSDDGKAEEIISAVLSICRTGRQLFYFTAQEDEVRRWKLILEKQDVVEHRFIPLGDAPSPDVADPDALPAALWNRRLPSPAGLSHTEYGRILDIPEWDLHSQVEMLHVWYLIDDVEKLHQVLASGFERWGALEQLIDSNAVHGIGLTREDGEKIRLRARALETWRSGWMIGRGKPVDRTILLASNAVSDAFIDDVSEMCDSVEGCGVTLLRALRNGDVSKFRSAKADELEEYLLDQGYIDTLTARTREDLWSSVVADLGGSVQTLGVDLSFVQDFLQRVASPTSA
jgi:uncharacterized protein YhaN